MLSERISVVPSIRRCGVEMPVLQKQVSLSNTLYLHWRQSI